MSFQQGLSGLNAAAKNLEVIGNNIANANTVGAKSSRAEFSDVYASSLAGGGLSIGLGTAVDEVAQQFSQGAITTTDNAMDIAINGAGFFQVGDGSQVSYTRNGQFKLDAEGYIVNNAGLKLLGYPADAEGTVLPGLAEPLRLPSAGIGANATTRSELEFNLDSEEAATLPAAAPFMDFEPGGPYNKVQAQDYFDSKGQKVTVQYYFQKSAENEWNVYATANGNTLAGTNAAPDPITTLEFTDDGLLGSPTAPVEIDIPVISVTDSSGNALYDTVALNDVRLDFSKGTQNAGPTAFTALHQDGYAPGRLTGVLIEDSGIVTARYSNGRTQPAGQIELANFRNPQGLISKGGNVWIQSSASGEPLLALAGQGNMGSLQSGAVEESNVDMTAELVSMITAQRNYQANAQTIKTIDQIMQTLVNLR